MLSDRVLSDRVLSDLGLSDLGLSDLGLSTEGSKAADLHLRVANLGSRVRGSHGGVARPAGKLPEVSPGWGASHAHPTTEGPRLVDIGLGRGTALDTVDDRLIHAQGVS